MSSNRAGHGARAIAALHPHHVTWRERIGEPVDLFEGHLVSEQLRAASDDDLAGRGANRDDVQRLRISTRQAAALADGETREAVVLADDVAARRDQRPGRERERVGVIEEIAELRE